MNPLTRIAALVVLTLVHATSRADDPGITFHAAPNEQAAASEQASVSHPAGGEFVYAQASANARPRVRFAVGVAPRSDFTVFSAEEQAELENLRQRELAKQSSRIVTAAASQRLDHPARHAPRLRAKAACETKAETQSPASSKLPKVVHDGSRVCVPKLDFAEQPDWREHLWCFNRGDSSVR